MRLTFVPEPVINKVQANITGKNPVTRKFDLRFKTIALESIDKCSYYAVEDIKLINK